MPECSVMTIKVFHVVRQYHPSIGGLEDVVYNIAQQQLRCGQQAPTVVTLDRLFRGEGERLPAYEVREGVPVIRLPYSGSSRYPLCWNILSAIREADVVHVHGVDFFFDFLALTRPLHRKPLLACSHGIFFHTEFASGAKKVFFNTVTRASSLAYRRIFATSANDGRLFGQVAAPARIEVIENGVNVDKFRLPPRAQLPRHLIYFGRWAENKGLKETLALFAALHRRDPRWRLTLAGREYDLDAAELAAEARRLGVDEAVQIAANPSQDALKGLIAEAGYFICQSRHEGFGLAAIEAMSGGLYPLLSPIPPFRRLVEETGLGQLLEGSEAAQLECLLARHEALADDYPALGVRLVEAIAHYSWQGVAQRYMAAYADAVSGQRLQELPS